MDRRPVTICECGDHCFIPLTRGHTALADAEYAGALGLWNWTAHVVRSNWYAARSYKQVVGGKRRSFYIAMHHVILPTPFGYVLDHENGNSLDNRRHNLRITTTSENAKNQKHRKGTTSRFRGVSRSQTNWRAAIGSDGVQRYLGKFDTEKEAAAAYDAAAQALHGEHARLNFPQSGKVS